MADNIMREAPKSSVPSQARAVEMHSSADMPARPAVLGRSFPRPTALPYPPSVVVTSVSLCFRRGAVITPRSRRTSSVALVATSSATESSVRCVVQPHACVASLQEESTWPLPRSAPPVPSPTRREDLGDLDAGHALCEAAGGELAAGAGGGRRDGRLVAVDVLAVDVVGAGDEGRALLAPRVALLEAVDFELGAEGVDEAHCVCMCVLYGLLG